jgi:Type II secretion system (T2SS), protein M subtype b
MIWREKRVLLIVLGLLLAANVIYFFTYRVQFQNRVDAFDERLEAVEAQYQRALAARQRTERTYQAYRQIERDTKQVFEEHWSTQPKRFTLMVAEVKRLASASNMAPPNYRFIAKEVVGESANRAKRPTNLGATEVGISFTVSGSYEQVRRLINLLELSRQFVIIDQISLSKHEGDQLTLNLDLKTLFRDEPPPDAIDNNRL